MPWFYYVARAILRILFPLLTRCQVKGKENIPGQGPVLVVANHLSLVDPPLLGICLRRKMVFMAKKELFHSKFTGYFIRGFGAFPVHRGHLDRGALRQADQALAKGLALIMFPEGTRSYDGQLQSGFSGLALIALRNGVPILPVGITGTEKIRSVAGLLRRPEITVNIGQTFSLSQTGGKLTKVELTRLTDDIMGCIAGLLPPEYRGAYAGR